MTYYLGNFVTDDFYDAVKAAFDWLVTQAGKGLDDVLGESHTTWFHDHGDIVSKITFVSDYAGKFETVFPYKECLEILFSAWALVAVIRLGRWVFAMIPSLGG